MTSARSWLRVGQLLLDDGRVNGTRVLPRGWVTRMTTGGVTNPNYGMQLWVNEPVAPEILRNGLPKFSVPRGEPLAATDAFYVEGRFAQRLHVVPSAGLVVVRLGDDRIDWDDAKLMNGLIRASQAARAAAPLPPVKPLLVAFERFVLATGEQPIVLMGHSQGAFHVRRLISDVIIPRGLTERLVVAYVIGIAVPAAMFDGPWSALEPRVSAEQTGCVMSWSTFGPDGDAGMYQKGVAQRFGQFAKPDGGIEIACTNPLTGSPAAAPKQANLGAVPVPGAYLGAAVPGVVGAECDEGLLRLSADPGDPFRTLVMPGAN